MKKTIKMVAAMAAVTTAIALSGCGTGDNGGSQDGGDSAASDSDVSATLLISTLGNPFFVSVADGAKKKAKDEGITLDVQNANNSDQTSLNQATTALTKKPDVLVLDPVGADSGAAITKNANQAGVPVVAFDRKPASGELASFIGYDAIQAGINAADSLAEALDEKGKVVEIQGILGTDVAQDRSKGFNKGIKEYPDIDVVAVQSADFDRGKALDVMTNVLQAHPKIDGVYAANDEMAMGVIAALKARNLDGKVKVVGNDGIGDALEAIKAGTMYSTNAESPFVLGKSVIDIVAKVAAGETVDKSTVLEGKVITQDDVADFCDFLKSEGDSKTCADLK